MSTINRREVLEQMGLLLAGGTLATSTPVALAAAADDAAAASSTGNSKPRKYKLGLVTYNLAPDWDLQTIIDRCKEVGLASVEFRTTHKHGVEPTLSKSERAEVKKRCAEGGLVIWCLGSICEFHSPDPAVVAQNIDEAKRFIELAHDLGCPTVKVRPNGLPQEVAEDKTLEQIGRSLRALGEFAAPAGVQVCCEVHGRDTCVPSRMRRIMDAADHLAVGVTWNSNPQDVEDGSIEKNFHLLRKWIYSVHINELISGYPYRELFNLLTETGYDRYTMIEAQGLASKDPKDIIRFMKFYKALWEELSRPR